MKLLPAALDVERGEVRAGMTETISMEFLLSHLLNHVLVNEDGVYTTLINT